MTIVNNNETVDKPNEKTNSSNIKTTIFEVLIIMLRTQEISMLVEALLLGSELMQYLGFPLNSNFNYIWKKTETVKTLAQFTKYFEITIYFESTPEVYLFAFYLMVLLVVLIITNLIYVTISVLRKKFTVVWPLRILRSAVSFIITILFMPIIEVFVSIVDCIKIDDKLVIIYNPDIVCWTGQHYIHVIMGILFAILFCIVSLVVQMCYFESRFNLHDHGAKANARADCFLTISKIINIMLKSFFYQYKHLHWAILIISWAITYLMFYFYYNFHPDYDEKAHRIKIIVIGIYLWANTVIIIGKIFENSEFDNCVELLFLGSFIIIAYFLLSSQEITRIVSKDISLAKTSHDALLQIRTFIFLIENSKHERQSKIELNGLISTLSQNTDSSKHKYFKSYLERKSKSKIENVSFLYQHVKNLYQESIYKFPFSVELRISYAYFLLDIVQNKNLALIQLEIAFKSKPAFDEQFTIYRCKKLIEASNFQENASLDIISNIAYKNYFNQFKSSIQQTTNLYIEFWTFLLNPQHQNDYENLVKLNELGTKINFEIEEVNASYKKMKEIKANDFQAIKLYSEFLFQILNEKDKSNDLKRTLNEMETMINQINDNQEYDIENFSLNNFNNQTSIENYNVMVVSAETDNVGQILNVTSGICLLFGYTKRDLQGVNVNKLLPNVMQENHKCVLETKAYDFKNLMNNNLGSKATFQMGVPHKRVFACTKAKYLVPIDMDIKIFYSMEQSECAYFCKINKVNLDSEVCQFFVDKDLNIQLSTANAISLTGVNVKEMNDKNSKIYDYIIEIKNEYDLKENSLYDDYDSLLFTYYFEPIKITFKKVSSLNHKRDVYSNLKKSYLLAYTTKNSISGGNNNDKNEDSKDFGFELLFMNLVVSPVKFKDELIGYIFTLESIQKKAKYDRMTSFKRNLKSVLKNKGSSNILSIKDKAITKFEENYIVHNNFIPKSSLQFGMNLSLKTFIRKSQVNVRKDVKDFAEIRFEELCESSGEDSQGESSSQSNEEIEESEQSNLEIIETENQGDQLDQEIELANQENLIDDNEDKNDDTLNNNDNNQAILSIKKSSMKKISNKNNKNEIEKSNNYNRKGRNSKFNEDLNKIIGDNVSKLRNSKNVFKRLSSNMKTTKYISKNKITDNKNYNETNDVNNSDNNMKKPNMKMSNSIAKIIKNENEIDSSKTHVAAILSASNYYNNTSLINTAAYFRYCYTQNKIVKNRVVSPLFSSNKLEEMCFSIHKLKFLANNFVQQEAHNNSKSNEFIGSLVDKLEEKENLTSIYSNGNNELKKSEDKKGNIDSYSNTKYNIIKQIEYTLSKVEKQTSIVILKYFAFGFALLQLLFSIILFVVVMTICLENYRSILVFNYEYDFLLTNVARTVVNMRNMFLIKNNIKITDLTEKNRIELYSLYEINRIYSELKQFSFKLDVDYSNEIDYTNKTTTSSLNTLDSDKLHNFVLLNYDVLYYQESINKNIITKEHLTINEVLYYLQSNIYNICKQFLYSDKEANNLVNNILINANLTQFYGRIFEEENNIKKISTLSPFIIIGGMLVLQVIIIFVTNHLYLKVEERKESYLEVFLEIGENVIFKSIKKCEEFNRKFISDDDILELSSTKIEDNNNSVDFREEEGLLKDKNSEEHGGKVFKHNNKKAYGIKFILSIPLFIIFAISISPIFIILIKFNELSINNNLMNSINKQHSYLLNMLNFLREDLILDYKEIINLKAELMEKNSTSYTTIDFSRLNTNNQYLTNFNSVMNDFHSNSNEAIKKFNNNKNFIINDFFTVYLEYYYFNTCGVSNIYMTNTTSDINNTNYSISQDYFTKLKETVDAEVKADISSNSSNIFFKCESLLLNYTEPGINSLLNSIYSDLYMIHDLSSSSINKFTQNTQSMTVSDAIYLVDDQINNYKNLIEDTNEFFDIQMFVVSPAFDSLINILHSSFLDILDNLKIIVIIMYVVCILFILFNYFFYWKRFELNLDQTIYKTKNMLSIIPKEVLASLDTIHKLLNIQTKAKKYSMMKNFNNNK